MTFASLLCRFKALRDRVNAENGLAAFQPKLVKSLGAAIARLEDARIRCGESNLKKAKKRIQQAGKADKQYVHRLSGLAARKKIEDALRQDFLMAGEALSPDVTALRAQVACPAGATP